MPNKIQHALLFLFLLPPFTQCSFQGEVVGKWAETIGNELWRLGEKITMLSEIKASYGFFNAQVETKQPEDLLAEITNDIYTMLKGKIAAVKRIVDKAEDEAENFEFDNSSKFYYINSKYSPVYPNPPKYPLKVEKSGFTYFAMRLNNDTHFYNLAVDTFSSAVHVPMNVHDLHEEPATAIRWSEALTDVFIKNYRTDPSLSWQYFGSASGVMRHYPAKEWASVPKQDLFDCRIRTWFIEAATCTKDLIIVIDNSGSMDAMGRHIGIQTAKSILSTLSNNDFVNILNYTKTTEYLIPCFNGTLVQATPENIIAFKNKLDTLKPENKTDLGQALVVAFELLEYYRNNKRECSDTTDNFCNQAIMIITDGFNRNVSDVIMKYNRKLNSMNGTDIPVRIFTYLVGREINGVEEAIWTSCSNRGFYTPVPTLERVTEAVLKYIDVVARPLVLSGEHPASWTHPYMDETYNDETDEQINEPFRLLTSVAMPAFDRKTNKDNSSVTADILGVAGTDVPIDDIIKLSLPYEIGVNGYPFIISNNGYVLMHPDLRPMQGKKKKKNYNSIDFTEIEQLVDGQEGRPPRNLSQFFIDLRYDVINGTGSKHNLKIKYHYDEMRRVSEENFHYYYTPLSGTPFTLGIALPDGYGNKSLKVGDEIYKNRHTGLKLTDFFNGTNWKVHPKWVYCRYHYLEGHEFNNSESELKHFLSRMYQQGFIFEKQYQQNESNKDQLRTLKNEDYYCDKQLVQKLIFDAKNTKASFEEKWSIKSRELLLFERYNVSVRFVATMSGLTRWDYLFNYGDNITRGKSFGDLNSRAVDETWYKSAVLQHKYDEKSFVYSVPLVNVNPYNYTKSAGSREEKGKVTGSYAIFPRDAGEEAPGCVVGYQFSQSKLKEEVAKIVTMRSHECSECGTCNTTLDCYIVDSSGYVIVSVNTEEHGHFFGELEPDIMESMLENSIFKKITVYDFQALCFKDNSSESCSTTLSTPLEYFQNTINWFLLSLANLLLEVNLYQIFDPAFAWGQNDTVIIDDGGDGDEVEEDVDIEDDDDIFACDREVDLFVLRQELLTLNNFSGEYGGRRSYYVKRIPYSNMIFVAVNNTKMKGGSTMLLSTVPRIIEYDTDFPCYKDYLNDLPSKPLVGCYFEHPNEKYITTCGRSIGLSLQNDVQLFSILFIIMTLTQL